MFVQLGLLLGFLAPAIQAATVRSLTPPMGWNSYNAYGCEHIDEGKVKLNAQALIDKQLKGLGYTIVTPDCAWNSMTRDSQGKMTWNSTTFPSGGKALGDYLHNRGLKFGMYSGGGHLQCNPWPITGSLGKLNTRGVYWSVVD
jgi:alpha-galactosidase